jgi:ubiquinone/menaquinone biosynthesis C-methylase UbiE
MLDRAQAARRAAGTLRVRFVQAESERLPLRRASIDVALVNGIFNLNPDRAAIFAELSRVLRPGGSVYGAELILARPLPEDVKASETDWFA